MIHLTPLKRYEKETLEDILRYRNESLEDSEHLEKEGENVTAWSSKFVYISYKKNVR